MKIAPQDDALLRALPLNWRDFALAHPQTWIGVAPAPAPKPRAPRTPATPKAAEPWFVALAPPDRRNYSNGLFLAQQGKPPKLKKAHQGKAQVWRVDDPSVTTPVEALVEVLSPYGASLVEGPGPSKLPINRFATWISAARQFDALLVPRKPTRPDILNLHAEKFVGTAEDWAKKLKVHLPSSWDHLPDHSPEVTAAVEMWRTPVLADMTQMFEEVHPELLMDEWAQFRVTSIGNNAARLHAKLFNLEIDGATDYRGLLGHIDGRTRDVWAVDLSHKFTSLRAYVTYYVRMWMLSINGGTVMSALRVEVGKEGHEGKRFYIPIASGAPIDNVLRVLQLVEQGPFSREERCMIYAALRQPTACIEGVRTKGTPETIYLATYTLTMEPAEPHRRMWGKLMSGDELFSEQTSTYVERALDTSAYGSHGKYRAQADREGTWFFNDVAEPLPAREFAAPMRSWYNRLNDPQWTPFGREAIASDDAQRAAAEAARARAAAEQAAEEQRRRAAEAAALAQRSVGAVSPARPPFSRVSLGAVAPMLLRNRGQKNKNRGKYSQVLWNIPPNYGMMVPWIPAGERFVIASDGIGASGFAGPLTATEDVVLVGKPAGGKIAALMPADFAIPDADPPRARDAETAPLSKYAGVRFKPPEIMPILRRLGENAQDVFKLSPQDLDTIMDRPEALAVIYNSTHGSRAIRLYTGRGGYPLLPAEQAPGPTGYTVGLDLDRVQEIIKAWRADYPRDPLFVALSQPLGAVYFGASDYGATFDGLQWHVLMPVRLD
jgi:hypothetical protein